MRKCKEIRMQARMTLAGRYGAGVGIPFIFGLISVGIGILSFLPYFIPFTNFLASGMSLYTALLTVFSTGNLSLLISLLASIFFLNLLFVGQCGAFLKIYRSGHPELEDLFHGLKKEHYARYLGGVLWMKLFHFLWSLLFVIPGIIKYYSYFAMPYLLFDCPDLAPTKALEISMKMMKGKRLRLFGLQLGFIGWFLLSIPTLGFLNIFFVTPYFHTTMAGYYDEVRSSCLKEGIVMPEDLQAAF